MQVKFTVFNCGTGYNRSKNDIIAQLNREMISEHMITDGPGSGGMTPSWAGGGHNPGGTTTVGGLLGGTGVDANVNLVCSEIRRRKSEMHQNLVVNMCGWSRGGVTCFKIANALSQGDTAGIPINIFAIDPVPGGSSLNNHMWQSISMTPNIKMCHVVFSQHDRRGLFSPYYPPVEGPFTDIDIMPGDHSTVAEKKAGREEVYYLVKDLAKRFLIARGGFFKDSSRLSASEILEYYAKVATHFDDYSRLASGVSKWAKFRGTYDELERTIRDVSGRKIAQMRPIYAPGKQTSFFINGHHRETCQQQYPRLTAEFDRKPKDAFLRERRRAWLADFDRMVDVCVEHTKLTMLYIRECQAAQGN